MHLTLKLDLTHCVFSPTIQLGGKIWLPEEYLIKIKTVGKIYEVTSARIIFSLCPIESYDVEAYYPR